MATTRKTKRRREERREPEPQEHFKAPPTGVLVAFGGLIALVYLMTDLRWGTVILAPMLVGTLLALGIWLPDAPRWLRAVGRWAGPLPMKLVIFGGLGVVVWIGVMGAKGEMIARELAAQNRPPPTPDLPRARPASDPTPIAASQIMELGEGKHLAASSRAKLEAIFALAKQNDQVAGEQMLQNDPDLFWPLPGTKVNVITDGGDSIVQVRERGTSNTFWIVRAALVPSH